MGNQPSLRRAIQNEKWSDVRHILSTQDGKARARTKSYTVEEETLSALHLACCKNAPPDVVHTLITTGQPLLTTRPSDLSALHCCFLSSRSKKQQPSPEVVRLLLEAFPNAVAQPNARAMGSKTPLHLACEQKASTSVIQMLYEANPTVAQLENCKGETPWDVARQYSWILHPKWRKKVKRILVESDDGNGNVVRVSSDGNEEQPSRPADPAPSFSRQRRHSSSGRSSRPTTPPPSQTLPTEQPPVATATLLEDNNTAASQFPVASATLVEPSAPPDTLDDTAQQKQNGQCVLCWEHAATVALVPCGHVCLCISCSNETDVLNAALEQKCPVCRGSFQRTLRVYPAGISSSGSS